MRIFAGGISNETNTFSPSATVLEDFLVQRGRDVLAGRIEHPSLDLSSPWGAQAQARGDTFIFSLMAWAIPSGLVARSAYECLREEVLRDLRAAMPVDVVLLNLHGAMVAHGYEDCEQDLIARVREIAGPEAVIGVELDLHCHLTEAKIAAADIVMTYKEYPHVDVHDRARELFDLATAAKLGHIRPVMALFDCRMIGLYPTTREPLQGFVRQMQEAERRRPNVLALSFAHGFQFADIPHVGAKVLAVCDGDKELARRVAAEFGQRAYGMRRDIGSEAITLPLDVALSRSVATAARPVVVADQSDNTGGGAPGDSTFALQWLIEHNVREAALAIVHDPEVAKLAHRAGVGARLPIRLGGKTGLFSGNPIDGEAEVLALRRSYRHALPQQSGEAIDYPVGDAAGLRIHGVEVVVGSTRCQCFSPQLFVDFGIDLGTKHIVVVKSAQHFHAGFKAIAAEILYMAAPGAVNPDPRNLPYRRLETQRMYPWVDDPHDD
jgi:microcystin degradation protein MlrC